MINVTKPYLPNKDEYVQYLNGIWERNWLTNHGPLVQELEESLRNYLGVKHLIYVNNGTIALQIAIKALNLTGEIITTPFSYVATTNSILWEGCRPIFADISYDDFNIDPTKIEQLITEQTSAILATHVYGNPCNVVAIEEIANRYNLKVIYDGAHSFDSFYKGKQLLSFGDVSTCSFHATKLFHTIEGGAIITEDDELAKKMTLFRQFGHIGDDYYSIGINGKNSEFNAAMGLCVLPMVRTLIYERKKVAEKYFDCLKGQNVVFPIPMLDCEYNYAYFPVVFESEAVLQKIKEALFKEGINTRRYFFPSLNKLPFNKGEYCKISEDISIRVLALPQYHDLEEKSIEKICKIIIENLI